jgi:hypothetical protein
MGEPLGDDLPELIDRAAQANPPTGHLDLRFHRRTNDHPGRASRAGPRRSPVARRLHPAVDRDVTNLGTALSQQLLHVPIGQAVARYHRTATMITSGGTRAR